MSFLSLSTTKRQYAECLQQHQETLFHKLRLMRNEYSCSCDDSSDNSLALLQRWVLPITHENCAYKAWQQQVIILIENGIAKNLLQHLGVIEQYKKTFNCHMCGMCCKMASSHSSYDAMQEKAGAGDVFAQEFVSVFLPYPSLDKAREVAPEVVDTTLSQVTDGATEHVYFYYCPYLGEDNRCSVFGTSKRPSICGSYPETPLSAMYKNCAWQPWKEATHTDTLAAHSMLALCDTLLQKLRALPYI